MRCSLTLMGRCVNSATQKQVEFFRHCRPLWFDLKRRDLVPETKGGVSFMLVPVTEGVYDFWLNICPMDATFSARQAVAHLRRARQNGTAPWGQVILDDRPIVEQLHDAVVNNDRHEIPAAGVGHQLRLIECINAIAHEHAQKAKPKPAIEEYK